MSQSVRHTQYFLTLCRAAVSIFILSFRFSENECLKSLFIDQIKWDAIKTSMPTNGNERNSPRKSLQICEHSIAECGMLVMAYRAQTYSMPLKQVNSKFCHSLHKRHNKAVPFNYLILMVLVIVLCSPDFKCSLFVCY